MQGFDHEEVENLVYTVNKTDFKVLLYPLRLFLVYQATRKVSKRHLIKECLELGVEVSYL